MPVTASSPAPTDEEDDDQAAPGRAATVVAVPPFRRADHVAVLTIHGAIDRITLRSLERRAKQALEDGADAIVFDIDTPGGELGAAMDICHLIKNELPGNTVAWVHPNAYSAGTIISLGCQEIVMSSNSRMGDAAPIWIDKGQLVIMPQAERAKIESPLIAEVLDSARRNRYDENLVKSFISAGVELWMLENDSGQRVFVDRQEYIDVFGQEPPEQITTTTPTFNYQVAPLTEVTPEYEDPEDAQSLPPVRSRLTRADRNQWHLVKQVISDDLLLVLTPGEAEAYGLSTGIIDNDEELKAYFGASTMTRYDGNWSESLVRFLTSYWVRVILIIIFILALFLEMAMPGVGVFGAGAGVALLILIGAPFLAGMAQWWDVLLIVGGLALIAIELFLIPGFGIPGVVGALCVFAGLVGTFVSGDLGTVTGQGQLVSGLIATLTSFFAAGVGIWLISRQIHSIPVLNRIILHAELPSGDSATVVSTTGLLEAMGATQQVLEPGDPGVAETDLRPAGRARFGDRSVDVKTMGSYIEKGNPVRVVSVGRFAIEVEEAAE